MVYAFLIHTVSPPAPGRVLYSHVFAAEKLEDDGCGGERLRLLRKERMAAVARQVQAAFQPCSASDLMQSAATYLVADPTAAPETETAAASMAASEFGALRLPAGDPCPSDLTALWLPALGGGGIAATPALALTLLCEEHDNLTLAESALRHLRRTLLEHLQPGAAAAAAAATAAAPATAAAAAAAALGREVLLRSDVVDAALAALVPFGQLLFLNHQFVLSAARELSGYAGAK